jgi:hypothetical protein
LGSLYNQTTIFKNLFNPNNPTIIDGKEFRNELLDSSFNDSFRILDINHSFVIATDRLDRIYERIHVIQYEVDEQSFKLGEIFTVDLPSSLSVSSFYLSEDRLFFATIEGVFVLKLSIQNEPSEIQVHTRDNLRRFVFNENIYYLQSFCISKEQIFFSARNNNNQYNLYSHSDNGIELLEENIAKGFISNIDDRIFFAKNNDKEIQIYEFFGNYSKMVLGVDYHQGDYNQVSNIISYHPEGMLLYSTKIGTISPLSIIPNIRYKGYYMNKIVDLSDYKLDSAKYLF